MRWPLVASITDCALSYHCRMYMYMLVCFSRLHRKQHGRIAPPSERMSSNRGGQWLQALRHEADDVRQPAKLPTQTERMYMPHPL
jgi:hypothetical protein